MADGKRYFWLKLYDDFFGSLRIKKLRKMAGGDTYLLIYLKMQLKAMKTGGVLAFRGVEQNIADELALDLDEAPDDVRVTLAYLCSCGLAETSDEINFFFPYSVENTGSEGASAQRNRDYRARKASLCDTTVTIPLRERDGEIEKEIEKDIEIEREKKKRFAPPTLEEVTAYCKERGNGVDPQHFFDYYTANGWKVGKNPMKDWKAAVRSWENNGFGVKKQHQNGRHKPVNLADLENLKL